MTVAVCYECDPPKALKNERGLAMHMSKTHGIRKKMPRARRKRQETAVSVLLGLTEQWTDGNGRSILTDDDGGIWLLKKIDAE